LFKTRETVAAETCERLAICRTVARILTPNRGDCCVTFVTYFLQQVNVFIATCNNIATRIEF
jgi:hypothetical protein